MDYIVDAVVRLLVRAETEQEAQVSFASELHGVICQSDYPNDPINSYFVASVAEWGALEEE